ncbi:MAG: aminodeoxychorismate lyase [Arsenophonus sp.]|nr:MAG: aminodeoxychorismate lyase [Arsenophonus sp.]
MICWINGQQKNYIFITNRSFQFGDGCFTTIRVVGQYPALLAYHIERLKKGVKKLFLPQPNWKRLIYDINKIAKFNKKDLAVIKVIISREGSEQGYSTLKSNRVTIIILLTDYPMFYLKKRNEGIDVILSNIPINQNPYLAGIKHLNRLEQILIKKQIQLLNVDEAIVSDINGILISCCASNIFWRKEKFVFTPKLNYSGVEGIMRKKVIFSLYKSHYKFFYKNQYPNVLEHSDEIVITNSLMPILPVNRVLNHIKQPICQYYSRKLFNFLLPYCLELK